LPVRFLARREPFAPTLFAAITGLAKLPPILHTAATSLWGNVEISQNGVGGMA
jgi:hypothetical protein